MDANHNPLRTPVRLEDNWVLKIPLLKAAKKYDRSSNLSFILLIFIPKINFLTFLTQLSKSERKVFSNHLSKVNLMIPLLPKLT